MNKRFLWLLLMVSLLAGCALPSPPPPPAPPTATPLPPTPTASPDGATEAPTPTVTPVAVAEGLDTVSPFNLLDIHFVDADNGWALDEAYLLRTEDGGLTWLDASPGDLAPGPDATAFFLDAERAWLLIANEGGTSGSLYRTEDGGLTWQVFTAPLAYGWLQFLDAQTGFALTDLGVGTGSMAIALYKTTDGGETWTQVYTNDPNLPDAREDVPLSGIKEGFFFRSPEVGWITGTTYATGRSYVYKTEDGGLTWSEQPLSLPAGFAEAFVLTDPPVFFSQYNGLMSVTLSSDVAAQVIFYTLDGGQTWQAGFPLNFSAQAVFIPPLNVYLWDGGETMYVSLDGGNTWTTRTTSLNYPGDLLAVSFADLRHGWVVILNDDGEPELYRSLDGGETWERLWP